MPFVTDAIDITQLRNVSSNVVREAAKKAPTSSLGAYKTDNFGDLLETAIDNLAVTNGYLSDMENEEIKWSLGETQSTHDLSIAIQKASTALNYTVTVRDRLLEAYKELMQMQI
ncbi:MAG: flagellar hook-basal body complex protein FliE [Lachnospiraceae bacterium]|nr:flagellar hook-basal body complex protein FliE [Lachnospiraceae bacterium]